MKARLYSLLLSAVITIGCIIPAQKLPAQMVLIPDSNFVTWLKHNGYSACMTGNLMDTTCSAVVNATFVDCSLKNIQDLTGIQYFHNLLNLNCGSNAITFFPPLPVTDTALNISGNQLTILPPLPAGLRNLACSFNNISSLPTLPTGLYTLDCSYNLLTDLPTLPSSLLWLSCKNNQLINLPVLPPWLTYLSCGFNRLANLPALPSRLETLGCNNNQLTNLPNPLSGSLTFLGCDSNQLTDLPALPDVLYTLSCSNNPNLTCLPIIPPLMSALVFKNTSVACIPNYSTVISNPLLSSLPYCYLSNPNGCTAFLGISTVAENISLSLLPNPAHNYVIIQTAETTTGASLQLNDIQGREISTTKLTSNNYRLETAQLSAGLYLVKVVDLNGRSGVRKLVIE